MHELANSGAVGKPSMIDKLFTFTVRKRLAASKKLKEESAPQTPLI